MQWFKNVMYATYFLTLQPPTGIKFVAKIIRNYKRIQFLLENWKIDRLDHFGNCSVKEDHL